MYAAASFKLTDLDPSQPDTGEETVRFFGVSGAFTLVSEYLSLKPRKGARSYWRRVRLLVYILNYLKNSNKEYYKPTV